jgi:AraC-like DNA-binding protein
VRVGHRYSPAAVAITAVYQGGSFWLVGGRTVAIQFVRAALDLARGKGHDTARPLEFAGIPKALLGQDAARVTEAQATRLVQALWDVSNDELIGLGRKPVPRGTFRMMSLAVIHSPDLATALRRLVEFVQIGMGFQGVEMVDDGTEARLSFDPGTDQPTSQQIAAIFMAVFHRFAGWLVGQEITLTSVELPGVRPVTPIDYALVYGVAPSFGERTAAITFASRYLNLPPIRDEAALDELLRRSPHALLFRRAYHPTATSRVRRILERSDSPSAVSVDTAATLLSVSDQHLRRLLREEGSSFRQLKEDVLRDEAVAGLVRGQETVDALSRRLGFSEPSAFRRAFRRWTGSPPSSYRAGD